MPTTINLKNTTNWFSYLNRYVSWKKIIKNNSKENEKRKFHCSLLQLHSPNYFIYYFIFYLDSVYIHI